MPTSEKTYLQVALDEPGANWELHCGELRRKPSMTMEHNDIAEHLAYLLHSQLDRSQFRVRTNAGRTRVATGSYYIPDVFVVPTSLALRLKGRRVLEAYSEPLPLVVEVWSPSTGDYDVETKLPDYRRRGDAEIWRIHPYERTLTAWRRGPDGEYTETMYTAGMVASESLPGVRIELGDLFE